MSEKRLNNTIFLMYLVTENYCRLLNDKDTRLFLETNEYLCEALNLELKEGTDAMYAYINS